MPPARAHASRVWLRYRLLATALAAVLTVALVAAEEQCCDVCLAQRDPTNTVITYDPVVHDECSAAVGICCYGCTVNRASPDYQSGVRFNADGEPEAIAGQRVRVKFAGGVTRLTFNPLVAKQPRTSFVANNSQEADHVATSGEGVFEFCVDRAGQIWFRGWGADSCRETTREFMVSVVASEDPTMSCESGTVHTPSTRPHQPVDDLAGTTSDDVKHCNPTRGVVRKRGDGSQYCECLRDWGHPPACDSSSWTKIVLTVLGAVAAALSIALSVHVYVKSKKAEKEETAAAAAAAATAAFDDDDDDAMASPRASPAVRLPASPASNVNRSHVRSSRSAIATATASTSPVRMGRETAL